MSDCEEALSLGVALLEATQPDHTQYKLIAAESMLGRPIDTSDRWRLTFKLRELIPETARDALGAGGELYVEVDLVTRRTRLLGHGE